jgi:hypothetical protein
MIFRSAYETPGAIRSMVFIVLARLAKQKELRASVTAQSAYDARVETAKLRGAKRQIKSNLRNLTKILLIP